MTNGGSNKEMLDQAAEAVRRGDIAQGDTPARNLARRFSLATLLAAAEGLAAVFLFLRAPSMARNAFLFGLSRSRLMLGGVALGVTGVLITLGAVAALGSAPWQRLQVQIDRTFSKGRGIWITLALLWASFVAAAIAAVLTLPAIVQHLGDLQPILSRSLPLTLWLLIATAQTAVLLRLAYPGRFLGLGADQRWQVCSAAWVILLAAWLAFWFVIMHSGLRWRVSPFHYLAPLLTAAMIAFLTVSMLHSLPRDSNIAPRLRMPIMVSAVFLLVMLIMLASAMAVKSDHTPSMAYYPELAESMLAGRLDLPEPKQRLDLTPHGGRWYVTHPPLVAFLLIPWVALSGVQSVNTVIFSAVFASATCALVFAILQALAARGWTQLGTASNLWLTAFFAFGTVHWWVGIGGQVWFLSQIVPLSFAATAVLLSVAKRPSVLIGASLGLAMLGRPNLVLLAPFLAGICIEGSCQAGLRSASIRSQLRWVAWAAVPVGVSLVILLWYNWARFGNALDFGYLTENVGGRFASDLRTYGQFSPHFIPRNISVMISGLPKVDPSCHIPFSPTVDGMSIFLTMPVLFWLVRAPRNSMWITAAWLSVLVSLVPLVLYYNTGAFQFGYRFFLDLVLPVICLLAVAAGNRVSTWMRAAIAIGILINLIGLLWWYGVWC